MHPAADPSSATGGEPRGEKDARRFSVLRYLPLVTAAAAIAFLELKADPSVRDIPLLPPKVAQFVDRHDFFKNLAGFAAFAAAFHFSAAGWRAERFRRVAVRAAWLCGIVLALEFAQLLIPARNCDWHDVVAGWIGIGLASLPWLHGSRLPFSHG